MNKKACIKIISLIVFTIVAIFLEVAIKNNYETRETLDIQNYGKTGILEYEGDENIQTGWVEIDGKKYYYNEEGVMQTGWVEIDNERYYFNSEGVMQTGWVKPYSMWYYLDEEGKMYTGWLEYNNQTYYLIPVGNDSYYRGQMVSGWNKIEKNGKEYWFYFAKSSTEIDGLPMGAMATGWLSRIKFLVLLNSTR